MTEQTSAQRALELLITRGQTVATCESLTGGLLGTTITDVPGASAAYRGGLITYTTDLKHRLAGVDDDLLATHGAVADPTAAAMAAGTRSACGADWGLATTGVAGPDPQEGHPVGTVFVAVAGPDGRSRVKALLLTGDRTQIRNQTVIAVLDLLVDELQASTV